MDKVRGIFAQVWKDHDISSKGFIDINEGYALLQEISTQ